MLRVTEELPRPGGSVARDILKYAPLLVVQGARQVGKSTLMRQALPPDDTVFVTLDNPETLLFAKNDPRGFVEQAPQKILAIDEAQRAPELALALKASIDEDRRPGRFAITGSTDLLKTPEISDSLAGRAESLTVYPLSQGEIEKRHEPEDWVEWIIRDCAGGFTPAVETRDNSETITTPQTAEEMRQIVLAGGYPEPLKRPDPQANRWFRSYIERLATHDAKELAGASTYPLHLENLLRVLASRGASELVKAKIARSLGISETALGDYLQLAESMYLINILPSWGMGFSGRAVRRPKISVADCGMASFFSGLTPQKARQSGGFELFGNTLEAFVLAELQKQNTWREEPYRLFHLRERNTEVDIVIELADGRVILVEVKSAVNVDNRATRHLETLMERLGTRAVAGTVLYLGEEHLSMNLAAGRIVITPIPTLWRHAKLSAPARKSI